MTTPTVPTPPPRRTPAMEMAENPTFLASYAEWVANPVTQRMLALARMELGPSGLHVAKRTAENALYYAGGVDKMEAVLKFLSDFGEYAKNMAAVNALHAELAADYGAKKMLASGEPV